MTPFVTAGAGFLLAVLWFDLMHDVLAFGRGAEVLPEERLATIAGYYGRVTTGARPMNRLIALIMLGTLASLVAQLARGDAPPWAEVTSLVAAAGAIGLAGAHTVPAAVRLGTRTDPAAEQSRLARAIGRDHLLCLAGIVLTLVLQLGFCRG